MREINAILTIAYRDLVKFLRDKTRIFASFIFPVIFIGALGGSLQANLGKGAGFNFLEFIFTGVLAQTLFQSTASGIISLIEDRENDFSQELFVSPVSRYTIIFGKILGESLVALAQAIAVIFFGILIQVPLTFQLILQMIPAMLIACLLGGAFGVLVLSNLSSQKTANQIFPFIIFPQFFLSGIFTPIKHLPLYLLIPSRIAPMTYAVDFLRNMYYLTSPSKNVVVLYSISIDLLVISALFLVFITVGTYMFIRNERNR